MENLELNQTETPFLHCRNNMIINVNKAFTDLTGYLSNDLIGKSIKEISSMLKTDSQILLEGILDTNECYLFTKSYEPIEVIIYCKTLECENEKMYFFVEKENLRISERFPYAEQLCLHNEYGIAIHSIPNVILLRANQKYLDYLEEPYSDKSNTIGRLHEDIVKGYKGSYLEQIWINMIETGDPVYLTEFEYDKFDRGVTYWDCSIVPIRIEGKVRYIIENVVEVTERVKDRKVIEEQSKMIRDQKEQLEAVIENMSDGVYITDKEGKISILNKEARNLIYQYDTIEFAQEAMKTTKFFDRSGSEITTENMPLTFALHGGRVKNREMIMKRPDKELIIRTSTTPIYDNNGNIAMVVSSTQDITDLAQKEKLMKEQKGQFEVILENMSDGIVIFDDKGKYVVFNKAARSMFFPVVNYLDDAGDGYEDTDMYDFEGNKIYYEDVPTSRVKRGEKFESMRVSINFPDKTLYLDVSGTPIYDDNGKFCFGIICCRNRTEQMQYEKLLQNQFNFIYRMIDSLELPIIRVSIPELTIKDINKKAVQLAKKMKPDLKHLSNMKNYKVIEIYDDFYKSEYYQYIKLTIKEKKVRYIRELKHTFHGDELYWNVIFEPVFSLEGEVEEILLMIIDITSEITVNNTLQETLKCQEEFLANISHELKTPLNVIYATTQLINMYVHEGSVDEKKDSMGKYVNSLLQNCYRLSKLINNIVDSSKIEAGFFELNLSNSNIVEVVEETVLSVTNYTDSKSLKIIFDTDTEEKIIACDAEKIERVVLNLISNAIKFSDEGNEIYVDIKDNNNFIEISVKDNGIGIENNQLEIIFNRFKQVDKSLSRNTEGTGIGLSIVKSIVELHEGKIYVESEFGKGSKFTVILPVRKVQEEDMLFCNKMRFKNELVQVELSDIY